MDQETSVKRKLTSGPAVAFKKFYSIRLRGTKEEHEWVSIGHVEIFSMSSGERQRRSRGI